MLKFSPFSNSQIFLSEKKDGSVANAKQAIKLLRKNKISADVCYFHHQHQAHRFYLNSKKEKIQSQIWADAIISTNKKICLAMSIADCFPIFITSNNKSKNIFALIHAGWKPLLQNIIQLTLNDLRYLYKIDLTTLKVWIGPGIKNCCYRFKQKPIQADLPSWQKFISQNNNFWYINLKDFIKNELLNLDIEPSNIIDYNACTHCNPDIYFSHQRNLNNKEVEGRMLVAIQPL